MKQENEDELNICSGDKWLLESVKMEEEGKWKTLCGKTTAKVEIETPEFEQQEEGRNQSERLSLAQSKAEEEERFLYSDKVALKRAIPLAPISAKVDNLCRYKCKKCDQTFATKLTLKSHLRKTKHAEDSPFNPNNYMILLIVHKCKICSKRIICETEIVRDHVYKHKIGTLKQYKEMTEEDRKVYMEQFSASKNQIKTDIIESAPLSKDIGNFCRYKCKLCGHITKTKYGMRKHFEKTGHKDPLTANINDSLIRAVRHQCQVCSDNVLCDKFVIKEHIRNHQIGSLKEYLDMAKVKEAPERSFIGAMHEFCKANSSKFETIRQAKNA